MVNFAHSLHSDTSELFEVACDEVAARFLENYNPKDDALLITTQDLPKIMNVFLDYKKMNQEMREALAAFIEDNQMFVGYEIWTELAIIYATKMDKQYKK